jgi:hypothetical protein
MIKSDLSDSAIDGLLMPLSNHKNIEYLDFMGNHITDKGALLVVTALEQNKSLKGLALKWNDISQNGLYALRQVQLKRTGLSLNIGLNTKDQWW